MVSKVASPKGRKKSATAVAVFPGSFDPLTNGHVDIVERSIKIFDRVVIGVLDNPSKQGLFTPSERVALISKQFARQEGRVEVMSFSGLLVEFTQRVGGRVIVRGLRAISDFDYEAQMAAMNRKLLPTVETVFLLPQAEVQCISSTLVREIATLGGDVSQMVSAGVASRLKPQPLQA